MIFRQKDWYQVWNIQLVQKLSTLESVSLLTFTFILYAKIAAIFIPALLSNTIYWIGKRVLRKYTGILFAYSVFGILISYFYCEFLLAVPVLIHFQNDSACMTTEGRQCLFPFKYRNRTDDDTTTELIFNKCSTLDIYRPWCPTSKNELSILYK